MYLNVNNRELATILASLRYWQRNDRQDATKSSEYDVATDGDTLQPLGNVEIDEFCERVNGGDQLPGRLVTALERVSAAYDSEDSDYGAAGEVEDVLDAAYAAGLGPQTSRELRRLLMAEIENEVVGGDSPTTLETVKDSLDSRYRPCDKFPAGKVKKELAKLIERVGGTAPAKRFVTDANWKARAANAK